MCDEISDSWDDRERLKRELGITLESVDERFVRVPETQYIPVRQLEE